MTHPGDSFSPEWRKAAIEHHCRIMNELARLSGSGISIFDNNEGVHVFTSDNFPALFGYDTAGADERDIGDFSEHIHPDDLGSVNTYGHKMAGLLKERQEFKDFKFTIEYRVREKDGKYVRVIEQHSVIEYHPDQTPWLSLSILDISPDQTPLEGVRCQIINFNTGEYYSLADLGGGGESIVLSKRETEILSMIKSGMSSKLISDKLFISIHTVNTHRQRILEKLQAGNSFEAIRQAERMGSI